MPEFRRGDALAGLTVAVVLTAAWPAVSRLWLGVLKPVAIALADGGPASGPTVASVVLPLAIGVLVAWPTNNGAKVRWAFIMAGITFAVEFALVTVGAALHIGPAFMTVAAGVVQNALPVAILLIAVRGSGGRSR